GGVLGRLLEFGELSPKRFHSALAPSSQPGDTKAALLLAVRAGAGEALDRETVVHVAAAAERRLIGRVAKRMAFWIDPLLGLEGGAEVVAALVARGVVEGSYEPATIYRADAKAPAALDE